MSFLILFVNSPQWLIMALVFQVFLVTIKTSELIPLWGCYLFFLVFLGGLLVIFVYVGSMISSLKKEYLTLIVLLSSLVGGVSFCFIVSLSSEISFTKGLDSSESDFYLLEGMTSEVSFILYLYIIAYLFLALFIICVILKAHEGPLRILS